MAFRTRRSRDWSTGAPDGEGPPFELVRTSEPLGQAAALNAGIRRARAPIVVVLDPSVLPRGDVVTPLVEALADPGVGDRRALRPPLRRPPPLRRDRRGADAIAIQGYLMAFRRADAAARGPLDESFRFYRNLDIWWSLVLRDEGEDAAPRRALGRARAATGARRATRLDDRRPSRSATASRSATSTGSWTASARGWISPAGSRSANCLANRHAPQTVPSARSVTSTPSARSSSRKRVRSCEVPVAPRGRALGEQSTRARPAVDRRRCHRSRRSRPIRRRARQDRGRGRARGRSRGRSQRRSSAESAPAGPPERVRSAVGVSRSSSIAATKRSWSVRPASESGSRGRPGPVGDAEGGRLGGRRRRAMPDERHVPAPDGRSGAAPARNGRRGAPMGLAGCRPERRKLGPERREPRRRARERRVGQVELPRVAGREAQVAERQRVDAVVDELRDPLEVAGRLRHLPAAHEQVRSVDPDAGRRTARRSVPTGRSRPRGGERRCPRRRYGCRTSVRGA